MFSGVRGRGLAYGSSFRRNTDAGFLTFSTYRAPDAYKAFAAAKETIQGYIDGTTPFDKHLLEGALSSIVVRFADGEADMATASIQSIINQVIRGVGKDWNSILLQKVQAVTEEDLKKVLREVVMGCFDHDKCVTICVAADGKVENIKAGFQEAGFTVEVNELEKFQDNYGLEVEGVVDTKDEDESDDDGDDDDDDGDDDDDSGSDD